jgi:hypothetical protein
MIHVMSALLHLLFEQNLSCLHSAGTVIGMEKGEAIENRRVIFYLPIN